MEQPTVDLTLGNGQTLGDLTPVIGQPLSQQTLAYAMLGASAANEVYNVGLPLNSYALGTTPVVDGAPLHNQRCRSRFVFDEMM